MPLARHDELVREAIESLDGYVVKTTGDGFHAAFASARGAVDAAVAAQLALGAEEWGATGPLRVRMGIHSGPAEVRDGDYYGTAVNKAARLMSVAHGGQIVVSLATEELVQDGEVDLVDLGEHALRGLWRAPSGSSRSRIPVSTASSPVWRRWTRSPGTCPHRSPRLSAGTTTSRGSWRCSTTPRS